MKLKRILPIIVALSVLLCALVPFAVSASGQYDDLSSPGIEAELTALYGGFDKYVFTYKTGKYENQLFYTYFPPIGSNFTLADGSSGVVIKHALKYVLVYTPVVIVQTNDGIESAFVQLSNSTSRVYSSNGDNASLEISLSAYGSPLLIPNPLYFQSGEEITLLFSQKIPSPLDSVKNVDMSPALVEVLGVLPACLACLVAYASIRKGIGYVHSIISNA